MNAFAPATVSPFLAHDEEFALVLGDDPRLELVAEVDAHEGPVYAADEDALYFTTAPRRGESGFPEVAIKRLALDGLCFPLEPERISVVREHTNAANGMTLDQAGRLVVCEQGTLAERARISIVDRATGAAATLVDAFEDLPLNSPNDVVVAGDGAVWFTDPSYGHLQGFRPAPALPDSVYRFDPAGGVLTAIATCFDKPNGLAFSLDERILHVGDNGLPHALFALPNSGRRTSYRSLLHVGTPRHPDGLKLDAAGRIYLSSSTGIQVLAPTGELIGEIELPGAVNFTFGAPDRNVLFITRDDSIWAAVLNTKGARP